MRSVLLLCSLCLFSWVCKGLSVVKSDTETFYAMDSAGKVISVNHKTGKKTLHATQVHYPKIALHGSSLFILYQTLNWDNRNLMIIDLKTGKKIIHENTYLYSIAVYKDTLYYLTTWHYICAQHLNGDSKFKSREDIHICQWYENNVYFGFFEDNLYLSNDFRTSVVDLKATQPTSKLLFNGPSPCLTKTLLVQKGDHQLTLKNRQTNAIIITLSTQHRLDAVYLVDNLLFFSTYYTYSIYNLNTDTTLTIKRPLYSHPINLKDGHLYCTEGCFLVVHDAHTFKSIKKFNTYYFNLQHVVTLFEIVSENGSCLPLMPTKAIFKMVWNNNRMNTYAALCPLAFLDIKDHPIPPCKDKEMKGLVDSLFECPSLMIDTIFEFLPVDLVAYLIGTQSNDTPYFRSIEWKQRQRILYHHLCYRLWHQDVEAIRRLLVPLLAIKDPLAEELYKYSLGFGIQQIGFMPFLNNQLKQLSTVAKGNTDRLLFRDLKLGVPHVDVDGDTGE